MATVRIRFRYSSLLAAGVAPCQIRVTMRNSMLCRLRPEHFYMSEPGDCADDPGRSFQSIGLTLAAAAAISTVLPLIYESTVLERCLQISGSRDRRTHAVPLPSSRISQNFKYLSLKIRCTGADSRLKGITSVLPVIRE